MYNIPVVNPPVAAAASSAYVGTFDTVMSWVTSSTVILVLLPPPVLLPIVTTPADCSSGTLYTDPISVAVSETIYTRVCNIYNNSYISWC